MRANKLLISAVIISIFFYNILGLFLISFFGITFPVSYFKYIFIILIPFAWIRNYPYFEIADLKNPMGLYLFVLLSFSVISTVIESDIDVPSILKNIQFFIVVPICYLFGRTVYYYLGRNGFEVIVRAILFTGTAALVAGLIEMSLGKAVWDSLDLESYFQLVMGFKDPISPAYGFPRSWISWDLVSYLDIGYVRMVSFFVEPVGLGRFFSTVAIICLILIEVPYVVRISKLTLILLALFSVLGIVLTLSKGGTLTILLYLALKRVGTKVVFICFASFTFLAGLLILASGSRYLGPSIINHYSNIISGWQSLLISPFGEGLSSNHVELASQIEVSAISEFFLSKSEGGFAIFSIVIGWLGLFLYFLLFYTFSKTFYESEPLSYNERLHKNFAYLCLAILLTSLFAHSAFSVVGSGAAFMLYGVLDKIIEKSRYNNQGIRNLKL